MHIGILAPEFPPAVGGMCAYAVGLATALARTDRVTVYTLEGRGDPALPLEQKPILTRDLAAVATRLAGEQPDVWCALNAALASLAPRLDAPFAVTFNGNDFLNPWIVFRRWWLEPFTTGRLRRTARRVRRAASRMDLDRGLDGTARIFAISTSSARLAEEIYPRHVRKIAIVPPGVDDGYFQLPLPCRSDGDASAPLRLLTVSRLEQWTRRKNVDGVLRAIQLLPPELIASYVIVGDGDDRPRLERLAAELGVSDRVRFAGRVNREELLRLYHASDLFLLAAQAGRNDVEGFGIVYLEAAAMGVPAICSRAGGAIDAVQDGVTGIILESSTPDAIAAGILRFARARRQFDAARLREFAERFRWPRIAAMIRGGLGEIAVDQRAPQPERATPALGSR